MSARSLGTRSERRTRQIAAVMGTAAGGLALMVGLVAARMGLPAWAAGLGAVGVAALVWRWMLAPLRRRRRILAEPFPVEWEKVLQRDVVFYRALEPEARQRFQRELQVFLGEKRITGIKTEVDTTTRVLAAASAVIPIFGFPEWEWDTIAEVLIYPGRFGRDYQFEEGADRSILGMVGTGPMNGIMILSKPDLLTGFRNANDQRNVGLHEFAHLIDKSDGEIDGIPFAGLDAQAIGPWLQLVHREMAKIEAGESDIDPYALTNEAEFFAVATEYLFERPDRMQARHPELFAAMQRIFHQDFASRMKALTRERLRGPRKLGRNDPCPCGSGKKFKKCCLDGS